jgi:hypothetical protein
MAKVGFGSNRKLAGVLSRLRSKEKSRKPKRAQRKKQALEDGLK